LTETELKKLFESNSHWFGDYDTFK